VAVPAAPVSVLVAVVVVVVVPSVPVAVLVVVAAAVSVPVEALVAVAAVSVLVALEVAVEEPPSGVDPPQAVNAAAITTLVAARAIVWNLRAINLVRLLLSMVTPNLGHKILFGLDHLHIDKLVNAANLKRPQ